MLLGLSPPFPLVRPQRAAYPETPVFWGSLCVALSTVIMAYSGLLRVAPILAFYALWFPQVFYKGRFYLYPSKDLWLPAILAAFALFSALWSAYPLETLRVGGEFASMLLCTVIMARTTKIESLIKGLVLGISAVLLLTLMSGKYGVDYFSGEATLVGLFGSKNQTGFMAEAGVFAAVLALFIKESKVKKFLFVFPALLLCVYCLALSRSVSAVLTLAVTLCATFTGMPGSRRSERYRLLLFTVVLGFFGFLCLAGFLFDWHTPILQAFHKDISLTGRTYLWNEGLRIGLENPVAGQGFASFWVPGHGQAEKLWYEFSIPGRSGFHFHNLFIEAFVELGFPGLLFISWLLFATCLKSLRYIARHGPTLTGLYVLGISTLFLARSFVEVDLWGAFGLGIFLFFSILPRLARPPVLNDAASSPSPSFVRP